jgi:hypothetical protein
VAAGHLPECDAGRGDHHAQHGDAVLGDHCLARRLRRLAHVGAPGTATLARFAARLPDCTDKRDPLRDEGEGEGQRPVEEQVVALAAAADQLENALADREEGAREEDHHGGEEGPEETVLAVTEGVLLVRRPVAQPQRGQQQALVGRVRDGVGGLGEHRGRAREHARDALDDGDRQVGAERDQHGDSFLHGSDIPTRPPVTPA